MLQLRQQYFPRSDGVRLLLLGILAAFLVGCQTSRQFPVIDTREPGWQVYQGQAIWRPKRDLPDLTGDLLFARHSDGRSFVQFTKTPLVLAEGHRNQRTWSIRFPPRNLSFGGSGSPPARFGWLQLDHAWSGYPVAKGWRFVRVDEGELHLENPQTGERMEVHLWP